MVRGTNTEERRRTYLNPNKLSSLQFSISEYVRTVDKPAETEKGLGVLLSTWSLQMPLYPDVPCVAPFKWNMTSY